MRVVRDVLFALALLVCIAAVVVGVALYTVGAAWIVAGVLGFVWAWLVLSGDSAPASEGDE
jgi:hypothetical protein